MASNGAVQQILLTKVMLGGDGDLLSMLNSLNDDNDQRYNA